MQTAIGRELCTLLQHPAKHRAVLPLQPRPETIPQLCRGCADAEEAPVLSCAGQGITHNKLFQQNYRTDSISQGQDLCLNDWYSLKYLVTARGRREVGFHF